jgi:uncharacterized integral membrane protein
MLGKTFRIFVEVLLFSVIAVWISNNYGRVRVEWMGYEVETSIPVMLLLAWLLFFAIDRVGALMLLLARPLRRRREKEDGYGRGGA